MYCHGDRAGRTLFFYRMFCGSVFSVVCVCGLSVRLSVCGGGGVGGSMRPCLVSMFISTCVTLF